MKYEINKKADIRLDRLEVEILLEALQLLLDYRHHPEQTTLDHLNEVMGNVFDALN